MRGLRVLRILALALVVSGGLSWFASSHPDGLEDLLAKVGIGSAAEPVGRAPMPGYTVAGIPSEGLSRALAGIAGTLATFGLLLLLSTLVSRRTRDRE
ncbi:MAG: PDGLE domain-containing protein [Planctomycetota bacterium]